jgi:hypothetical protein
MASVFAKGIYGWQQTVWGSIGFAAGSAVGGAVAAKETGSYQRLVLITGEGSLQLTVQALSMLVRHGIVPVIFVLNNGGYAGYPRSSVVASRTCGLTDCSNFQIYHRALLPWMGLWLQRCCCMGLHPIIPRIRHRRAYGEDVQGPHSCRA